MLRSIFVQRGSTTDMEACGINCLLSQVRPSGLTNGENLEKSYCWLLNLNSRLPVLACWDCPGECAEGHQAPSLTAGSPGWDSWVQLCWMLLLRGWRLRWRQAVVAGCSALQTNSDSSMKSCCSARTGSPQTISAVHIKEMKHFSCNSSIKLPLKLSFGHN